MQIFCIIVIHIEKPKYNNFSKYQSLILVKLDTAEVAIGKKHALDDNKFSWKFFI